MHASPGPILRRLLLPLLAMLLAPWPAPAQPARPVPGDPPSLRQMAGQMLMVGFRGTDLAPGSPILEDIARRNLGGVVLFDYDVLTRATGRNIKSPEQLRALTAALQKQAGTPLFIAVDQEGGRVARLKESCGFPPTRSAAELGAAHDPAVTEAAGAEIGATLRDMGLNLDFAPVADVNVNPDSPAIGRLGRSFSADPEETAVQAGAFIRGLHSRDVLSCVKHFPGHGSATADTHLGAANVTLTWTPRELVPYRRLLHDPDSAPDMVMTAHIFNARLDPGYPATLSKRIISGLLRTDLGWDGVVVSDDLQMKAVNERYGLAQIIALALDAGVDILLFGNNLNYEPDIAARALDVIETLVNNGTVPLERIRTSHGRIAALKRRLPGATP